MVDQHGKYSLACKLDELYKVVERAEYMKHDNGGELQELPEENKDAKLNYNMKGREQDVQELPEVNKDAKLYKLEGR